MKKLILLLSLSLAASVQAQKSIVNDIINDADGTRLEIRSVFDPSPASGYAPLRVVAVNGTGRNEVWDFTFTAQTNDYRRNNTVTSRLSLPVAARSTQSALFMAPMAVQYGDANYNSGHSLSIVLNSPTMRTFSDYSNAVLEFPSIAITKSLAEDNLDRLEDEVERKKKGGSSYYGGSKTFASRFDPAEAPEDWLGYSGFDCIMLTDTDWSSLKPGARNALLQWTRLGGLLHFYYASASVRPAALPEDSNAYGLGKIETFTWSGGRLPVKETVARYWGKDNRMKSLTEEHAANWSLLEKIGIRSFNSWQVIVFLVLFGVLVGPINLFILAPSGRRHRLFVTTPLLSLGASCVMAGLILFQDGIGGVGARVTYVELEPKEAAAYVTQKQISRTGVLFGSGFDAAQPALIEPLALPDTAWAKLKKGSDTQPVSLTISGDAFGGNFFQSRAEQAQMVRAAVSTRARLELQPTAGPEAPPSLVSALGFTVDEMFYADAQGQLWKLSSPLATGQKAVLEKADGPAFEKWWSDAHGPAKLRGVQKLASDPHNQFFAKARSAPGFTQETLSSIRWQTDLVVVHGSVTPP